MKLKLKSLFGLIMAVSLIQNSFFCYAEEDIKLSAPLFTNSAGITGKKAAETVFRIIVPKKNTMGTGFLHKSGSIITAAHVVSGCEPKDIFILLPQGDKVKITKISSDEEIDIASLTPMNPINGNAIPITQKVNFEIGAQVSTWGFPGGYTGRFPMLSVGYLSGIDAVKTTSGALVKRLVVNAAFNSGNSGGPLIDVESGHVIGVVSSKLAPIPEHIEKGLNKLKEIDIGVTFEVVYQDGKKGKISQSQLLEMILQYMRSQTQLVVGRAVSPEQLIDFINKHGLEN
jgi:S1-C subfamily serine protease